MSFISDFAAGGIEGVLNGVKNVVGAFKAPPEEIAKLQAALATAEMQLQAIMVQAVNQTMQAEAKSEHWMQWSWRPTFGFTGAAILVNNYILLPYFAKLGVVPISVPDEIWLMLTAVLGVAAWTRGQVNIEKCKHNGGAK